VLKALRTDSLAYALIVIDDKREQAVACLRLRLVSLSGNFIKLSTVLCGLFVMNAV
jgi:hypothetical protein